MIPPGRASSSQATTSAPCGPNQRVKCSARVQTSKTRSRGASKTRLTTTSSAGVASPPLLCTGIALLLVRRCAAFALELSQVQVETIEALLPEAAVLGGPVRDLAQRGRVELARAPLSLPAAGDEARVFENAQMFRAGWTAHREGRCELRHGCRSLG